MNVEQLQAEIEKVAVELASGKESVMRYTAILEAQQTDNGRAAYAQVVGYHESEVVRLSLRLDALNRELLKAQEQANISRGGASSKSKVRCPHYQVIRAFYAAAVGAGLDTKADGRIRAALSSYFGFTVWSRADLTAEHWDLACAGITSGELNW